MASPASVNATPLLLNESKMSLDVAPNAMRTPISSKLESRSERRLRRKVAIRKGFIHDRRRRLRPPVGDIEKPAFAQARTNGGEVFATHHPRERVLCACVVCGLTREEISRRLVVRGEGDSRNRASADDAGNATHFFQLRIDKGDALVEVAIPK